MSLKFTVFVSTMQYLHFKIFSNMMSYCQVISSHISRKRPIWKKKNCRPEFQNLMGFLKSTYLGSLILLFLFHKYSLLSFRKKTRIHHLFFLKMDIIVYFQNSSVAENENKQYKNKILFKQSVLEIFSAEFFVASWNAQKVHIKQYSTLS